MMSMLKRSLCSQFHYTFQYLKLARQLEGYGEISFPFCVSDSRKDGQVIASISFKNVKLQACKDDGTPEVCFHSLSTH